MNDSLQTAGKDANVGSQLGADAELFSGHEQHAINFNSVFGHPVGEKTIPPSPTDAKPTSAGSASDQGVSVAGFVHAEASLIASLPAHFGTAFKDNFKNHWGTLAVEAGVSLVAGAAIAAATKNPAIVGRVIGQAIGHENPLALGEAMATVVRPIVNNVPYYFGGAAATDIGLRLGTPAWDLMQHPEHKAAAEVQFAGNLSSTIQDYTVMGLAGAAGAKFSLARTMPYVNSGPGVDFSARNAWAEQNPGALNKASRLQDPGNYVFAEEKRIAPDVNTHYEEAFPVEERQHVEGEGGYNEKIAQGDNIVYTLRTKTTDGTPGELAAAHILGVHDQPDPSPASHGILRDFGNWLAGKQPAPLRSMHGDFIFVRDDLRSQGTGSFMYEKVVEAIQQRAAADGKHLVALTGEMEDPKEPAAELVNLLGGDRAAGLIAGGVIDDHGGVSVEVGAKRLLDITRKQFPHSIQNEEPSTIGRALLQSMDERAGLLLPRASKIGPATRAFTVDALGSRESAQAVSDEKANAIGEALQMLDERTRRQQFYWALSTPKVDSGIVWKIQDFADPEFRGDAHWTTVVFDANKFAPRETGYAFMTDEAGYTLDPNSQQVREYEQANNYYRGRVGNAYTAGSLLGTLGATQSNDKR